MAEPGTIVVVEIRDQAAMDQAWALRRRVFIEEQQVPEAIEMDADDALAFHVLALDADLLNLGRASQTPPPPVGCGRMVQHDDYVKIGRMAVLRERRGEGIGRRILEFLMDAARRQGFHKAVLHAQLHAEGFYLKCGYRPDGDAFEEAGIMHRRMEREI
jgi:predicted GNAT family N-acyltransferase